MHTRLIGLTIFLMGLAGCAREAPRHPMGQAADTASLADTAAPVDTAAPAAVAARASPELYAANCAQCHEGGVPKAPHSVEFQMIGPDAIHLAMTTGVMQAQAAALTDPEKRALAEFLGGRAMGAASAVELAMCEASATRLDRGEPPELHGWGFTHANTRFAEQAASELTARDVPRLRLKWAFGFPQATRARSQPAVAGGAVYVGSQDGTVYALDLASGCVRWTYDAGAEVRTSPVVEPWKAGDASARPRVFVADFDANVHALDASTGELLWRRQVDDHPRATLTGSPRLFEGRLYVPVSSTEWAAAADPSYECCTFRGGVVALDAKDGSEIWHGYTIGQTPEATGEMSSVGTKLRGPAGAPVWNSPTIDAKRRRLYVGTGESYTSPAAPTSDAVIAFDLDTGARIWHYQSTAGDAWNMACFIGGGPNCPKENGPDHDIGAPPILARLASGDEILLVGQKSADVFALDPDEGGKLLWKRKIGRGGYAGGVHWGMAFDGIRLYAPNADTKFLPTEAELAADPGLHAIDPLTGKTLWFTRSPDRCGAGRKPACDPGLSAAVSAIPGAVIAGGFDGWLRAYDATHGSVIWEFDTAREFTATSGERARGGSIESAGPVIAEGVLLVNSGYLFGGRMAGNVLLAFEP